MSERRTHTPGTPQTLPLWFLKFFGSTNLEAVVEAMRYAVRVQRVEHIILDNLQFMLQLDSSESGTGGFSGMGGSYKFDLQDRALTAFRRFATEENVHLTIVIHPKKEAEGQSL